MLFGVKVEKPILVTDPLLPIIDVTGIRPPFRDDLGWIVDIVDDLDGHPPALITVARYRLITGDLVRAALMALSPFRHSPQSMRVRSH